MVLNGNVAGEWFALMVREERYLRISLAIPATAGVDR
jgi:hypothetical protein